MKLKINAVIEVNKTYGDLQDEEEIQWIIDLLNDKENTVLILHSNDIGDEIGHTSDFKIKQIEK